MLVRLLTHRWRDATERKYPRLHHGEHAALTADQAQSILTTLAELEFPKLYSGSLGFALSKSYGIPSISSLLVTTGELHSADTASKRAADTSVIAREFCANLPSSQRALEAVARTNYVHSFYIKADKISNREILYALTLFALEPVRWVNKYEWRSYANLELCATGTFWKDIGDKMGIDCSPFTAREHGRVNGAEWLNAMRQ